MQGDAIDASKVEDAVNSHDAVISALGVSRHTPLTICSEATKNIIAAVKKNGVKRIIVESAYGAGNARKGFYGTIVRMLIGSRIKDKEVMEKNG